MKKLNFETINILYILVNQNYYFLNCSESELLQQLNLGQSIICIMFASEFLCLVAEYKVYKSHSFIARKNLMLLTKAKK
jgi:hypothetical protein